MEYREASRRVPHSPHGGVVVRERPRNCALEVVWPLGACRHPGLEGNQRRLEGTVEDLLEAVRKALGPLS